jgi:hypothetical protein
MRIVVVNTVRKLRLGVGAAAVAAIVAAGASTVSDSDAIATIAATATATQTGQSPQRTAAACTAVTNIEAIIDDSGSMLSTDSNRLRVAALDLLISKPQNARRTLGAVEFGSRASSLFRPELIGPNERSMKSLLNTNVRGNDGGTNYNEAFTIAKTENPKAQARIFLTDGGHNAGLYENGHRGGPPTYVIGLTIGPASPSNPAGTRLRQIASETGGKYYPQQDASTLQATVNAINATFDCQQVPGTFTDTFTKQGQTRTHSTAILEGTRTVELTTTWSDPTNKFALTGLGGAQGGTVVGRRTVGATYVVLLITKPPRGRLKFSVEARRLVTGKASVITQIAQNRRSSGPVAPTAAKLRMFVDQIENVLAHSAAERRELGAAITAGFSCSISARVAGQRIDRVVDKRQSNLDRLGSLQTPTRQAGEIVTLLQRALRESIEADRHYRDGFFSAATAKTGCPVPSNANFELAQRSDARATAAKERFVAAFNPLAKRFHRRTWLPSEI